MKTKFAVAFAAAVVSFAAQADVWTDKTITEDTTLEAGTVINSVVQEGGKLTVSASAGYDQDNSKGDYTLNDGTIDVQDGQALSVRDFVMNGGTIDATGSTFTADEHSRTYPAFGAYNSFVMNDGEVTLSNGGRLWIGTAQKENPNSYGRMALRGGTINFTGNGYITGNKRVINSTTMEGYVGDEVLAGNTIGFDGVTVNVTGNGNTIDALKTEITGGEVSIASNATLTVKTSAATNETDPSAATKAADINSLRMTGGKLIVAGTMDASELNTTDFVGGVITMAGGNLNTGKNTTIDTDILVTAGGSTITGESVKMTGGSIAFDPEGDSLGLTFTADTFDMTGGTIDTTHGRIRVNADTYLGGGLVKATHVFVDSADAMFVGLDGNIDFNVLEIDGATVETNTFAVNANSELFFNTKDGAIRLTGENASFTNAGTLKFYGLTGHDQGKKLNELLGIAADQFTNTGTADFTENGNQFITSLTYDVEKGLQVTVAESVDALTDGTLKGSKYAGAGLAVAAGAGDIQGDMTAAALAELGTYTDYMDNFNGSASKALAYVEDQIETASARGLAAYTVANDIQRLINDGVESRNMMSIHEGAGVWANVFYSQNGADSVYGSKAGYETDIYGGQLGFDWTATCGGRLGAVLTIGTADSNNTGANMTDTDIDSDFYGLSVYASKQIERLTFGADIGYTKVENDLTTKGFGRSFDDSVDADIWTVGVRTNILAWDGDVVKVTPHFGVRYNHIDMDDMGMTEHDGLNVIEMPVGVAFSGNFETAGWTIAPVVDLSLVPQIGDKDVNIAVQGAQGEHFDVIDGSLFRTTLGVEASVGNFGLGVNYKYGTSSDDRDDHSVNVKAVYRF